MLADVVDAIFSGIAFLLVLCVIFVPLGIWKLIDIIIWVDHHFHIKVTIVHEPSNSECLCLPARKPENPLDSTPRL